MNLTNILRQQTVIVILSFGAMLLIVGGMIDLSIGAVLALSGCMSIIVYKAVPNILLAFVVAIAVAVVCNFLNGLMITAGKAPPFIATLAMLTCARGLALLICGGKNIYNIGNYNIVGQTDVFGFLPITVLFMLIIMLIMYYITVHRRLGRSIYAVGGNQDAARASGINVKMVKMQAFLINGVLIGICGVLYMSRVNGGLPNGANGYELDAITAAIIGGTSFTGGEGTIVGTFMGAIIIGFLSNIMNLLTIDSYVQQIIRGIIIASAVMWDIYSKGNALNRVKKQASRIEEKK
jgi:inositol transport system permease protein